MTSQPRPTAPHGIEVFARHAVICAKVEAPGGTPSFIDVLLLPVPVASHALRAGGYTYELSKQTLDSGARLIFAEDTPGRMGTLGYGRSLKADLHACEGGVLLPGRPPPLPFKHGEPQVFPFCFLVGVDAACEAYPGWKAWAESEGIALVHIHNHVHGLRA